MNEIEKLQLQMSNLAAYLRHQDKKSFDKFFGEQMDENLDVEEEPPQQARKQARKSSKPAKPAETYEDDILV